MPKSRGGKLVRGDLYFHISALSAMLPDVQLAVREAQAVAQVSTESDFNVVKISRRGAQVSLLRYAEFFSDPFPQLRTAWTIRLASKECRRRQYLQDSNPPILHRKELLLAADHPDVGRFASLTVALENRGLLPNGPSLGFRRQWQQHLQREGVRLEGHTLVEMTS